MSELSIQIGAAQRKVRTDAYQMSIGEIVSLYDEGDLRIDPEFQRLFRWEIGQKAKLIESLLLGIPIPSIFVFETTDGKWELVDGLQRLSTILEFMGKLRDPDCGLTRPSLLEATRYLPALHNAVWERSEAICDVPFDLQLPLERTEQLAIRRARIGVEILKRPSDEATKFDLFQRLNAGGTVANPQELRNSIVLMVNAEYFCELRKIAEDYLFQSILGISEEQTIKQRHIELAMRFLVHTFIPYDGRLDVEEYIDEGSITLAREANIVRDVTTLQTTVSLINDASGPNAVRRFDGTRHSGRIGLVALESIAVGIARNLSSIIALDDPTIFVKDRIESFWNNPETGGFTSPGVRGTVRIQRTVPFGTTWFAP